jgi:eukaryotic-like serine/threonine-protein kinase
MDNPPEMVSEALATQSYEPSAAMPPAPTQIGRFEVRSEIGRGSNGVVYAAFDPVLGREVAIKAIPLAADNQVRRRAEASFLQEAKSAAGLNHPGIVTVFDAGKTETAAYIAMERLYGHDLHDWLSTRPKLAPKSIASMMARVADAVHYAHRRGVIHRDLKPSNIFLTRDMKPKVLDFGVALAQYTGDTQRTRQLIGTPNYMSPEQALGRELDGRSDVFSMGSILYELLTGQRAFDGNHVEETLSRVASQPPTPIYQLNPEVPAELIEIVQRAMAKDASDRFQSAAEMRNALVLVAHEESGRRPTLPPETRLPPALNQRSARLVVAALAVSVSIVILALEQPRHPATVAPPHPAPLARADVALPNAAPADVAASSVGAPIGPDPVAHAAAPMNKAIAALPPPPRPSKLKRKAADAAALARQAAPSPSASAPAADGSIALGVTPWGEILVDGTSHGVSPPLTRLTLAAGSHTIEIRNGAASPYVSHIDVQPGQTVELQHRF